MEGDSQHCLSEAIRQRSEKVCVAQVEGAPELLLLTWGSVLATVLTNFRKGFN